MAVKPNYRRERSDRATAKAQKKQDKLQRREDEAVKRKDARHGSPDAQAETMPAHDSKSREGSQ